MRRPLALEDIGRLAAELRGHVEGFRYWRGRGEGIAVQWISCASIVSEMRPMYASWIGTGIVEAIVATAVESSKEKETGAAYVPSALRCFDPY